MVQAWYMNDIDENPRLEYHQCPPKYLTEKELYENCGVKCVSLDLNTYENHEEIAKIRHNPNFTSEVECVISKQELSNYEELSKENFIEHLHVDDEVRMILDGSAYFDVRDKEDKWIRILQRAGDLIIIPCGSYHRFTTDTNHYVKGKGFFMSDGPDAPQYDRPAADHLECRTMYLKKLSSGYFTNKTFL